MLKLNRFRLFLVGVAVAFLPASFAQAWIESGHKIVGLIVWNELSPTARTKAMEILKAHPRFKEDLMEGAPEGIAGEEADKYAFAEAACWPDTVRSQNNPMHTVYNHPDWHFIDIPYVIENQAIPKPKPTTQPGPQDIIEAMVKNMADLKDPNTKPADRAIALCWVLHLVGDIHQPLHCSRFISKDYPDGDKGGNNINVLRDPPYPNSRMNLHLLWDSLPGQFKSEKIDDYVAAGVEHDSKLSRDALKVDLADQSFKAWADASHELAVHYAYLDGNLKGQPGSGHGGAARDRDSGPTPGVPRGYVEKAEEVAMRQIALAGYRGADLLMPVLAQ